jgi:hypothetical protein
VTGRPEPPPDRVLAQAVARIARADYPAWAAQLAATGNCTHPVRLKGHLDRVNPDTGETTREFTTTTAPDRVLLKACTSRRATRCPSCAAVYRSDARALVLAGLIGGKGLTADVQQRPVVFVTLTAPSFGAVHTVRSDSTPCHPRTTPGCTHGRVCRRTHDSDDAEVGGPVCPDCYDWAGTIIFNARSTELWRRTIIATRRALAVQAGIPVRHLDQQCTVAFVKIVEFQTRGVVHFHALLRLDPAHPDAVTGMDSNLLGSAVRAAAARTATPNPLPTGHPLRWGTENDITPVPSGDRARLAGYLAKYTTKSVDHDGALDRPLTHGTLTDNPAPDHLKRLAETAWHLADTPSLADLNLQAWAHTLGYRGHWLTKSRHWSTTLTQLRTDRHIWQLARHGHQPEDDTTIPIGDWEYHGNGHTNPGDAWLAAQAAESRRRQRRTAWEES